MAASSQCYAIVEDRQWLDCYYRAAQPMRALLGLAQAPQAGPVSSQRVSPPLPPANRASQSGSQLAGGVDNAQAQQFGLSNSPPAMPRDINHIMSRMASYEFDRQDIFTVTLANGQVWRQISGDTDNAHWDEPAKTYVVTIDRGFLGSYNLRVQNHTGMFKVTRLK